MTRMRILILDDEAQQKIDAAIALARAQPMPRDELERRAAGHELRLALGFEPWPGRQLVQLVDGYQCCISFEQQPLGLCRHLSISVERRRDDPPDPLPHPEAVVAISKAFGIEMPVSTFIEEYEPGRHCINVIGFDDTTETLRRMLT